MKPIYTVIFTITCFKTQYCEFKYVREGRNIGLLVHEFTTLELKLHATFITLMYLMINVQR